LSSIVSFADWLKRTVIIKSVEPTRLININGSVSTDIAAALAVLAAVVVVVID
jgi:hypothetical protein